MQTSRSHQTLHLRIVVGKIGGAVGMQASFGARGIMIQQKTMEYLGIGSVEIANQIVQRNFAYCFVCLRSVEDISG